VSFDGTFLVPGVDGLANLVAIGIFDLREVTALLSKIPSFDEPGVVGRRGLDVVVEVH